MLIREEDVEPGFIDLPTLVFLIVGGLYLGASSVLGFDPLAAAIGTFGARAFQGVVGASAIWQLFRQKY